MKSIAVVWSSTYSPLNGFPSARSWCGHKYYRSWLGHVSVNTINIYAEVNMRMKADALKTCEISNSKKGCSWKEDKSLLAFLKSI